ncbi:hypothetical protein S83_060677 [Arachis hypogaea]
MCGSGILVEGNFSEKEEMKKKSINTWKVELNWCHVYINLGVISGRGRRGRPSPSPSPSPFIFNLKVESKNRDFVVPLHSEHCDLTKMRCQLISHRFTFSSNL